MSEWLPSLNALRAYEAVSRHLSYKKAADELNVTPAAVKQLVNKLEASIGTVLIKRKGQGLELSPRGSQGLDDLSAAMKLMQSSVSKLRSGSQETRLFLSVESSFATAWLVPRLEGFRARHPEVTVLIDSNQSVVDLERGNIDLAIRYGVKSDNRFVAHRLFEDQVFPACSPSLINGSKPLNRPIDLKEIPLIHWDLSQLPWAFETTRWFTWKNWFERNELGNAECEQGLYFSEYGQAVQAAIAGQGMLLASWPILHDPIDNGLLIAPFQEYLTTDIGYQLVVTKEARKRWEVSAFIEWLLELANAETEFGDEANSG